LSKQFNIQKLSVIPGVTVVYVPETITVHLGAPDEEAENVTVNFIDYIENVASSELYPTWPEDALRANIHAIVSIAMNRIFTEWYRSRGYNFDITSSTQYDQSFVYNRGIFENISQIVAEIFDQYIIREGRLEPLFAQYCDGRVSQCEGMYQWGTVDLAEQGYDPYEILQYYYGNDINLVKYSPVGNIETTYPGTPLKLGDTGDLVLLLQFTLNVISTNYPGIPKILPADGVFSPVMESAVKTFQKTFNLPSTGIVDKGTWYKIKNVYVAVRKLAELTSQGTLLQNIPIDITTNISEGEVVPYIQLVEYFLNVLSAYYATIPAVDINGILDESTRNSIIEFQKTMGLPATGIIDNQTLNTMYNSILGILVTLPPAAVSLPRLIFPGTPLKRGSEGPDVLLMQEYLAYISTAMTDITYVPYDLVDGVFGPITESAVITFQQKFGLNPNGIVDEETWNTIVDVYRNLRFGETRLLGQFPGENLGEAT